MCPRYVMNIFAYQDRYRTVTGTRYIGLQVCPGCQICMHLARGQPSMPPQPLPMHITLGRENRRLVCKLGTCIPPRRVYISVYLLKRGISRLDSPPWPNQRQCGRLGRHGRHENRICCRVLQSASENARARACKTSEVEYPPRALFTVSWREGRIFYWRIRMS